jgi:glycerol-3-phosphate dehydrogenase
MYDVLAGRRGLGPPSGCRRGARRNCCPRCGGRAWWGGVKYWDGQFDDARLAVLLARTAANAARWC